MKYLYLYLFSRNILHSALFLFVFVLLNTALPAQDNSVIDSDKTAEGEDFFTSGEMWADEIVVTATKGEKTVRNAPGAVTVITKEEIDARPTAQMHTLLNAIPGFYSQQGDNFSVFGSTTVRGISGDRMVFMLDGMPVKDPRAGGFFAEGISPSSLERVESVRGPMSALYGSGLAGAVNFITKMPEKREFTAKADYGNPFVEGTGNANAWTAYFSYGDKLFDCLSILLSYNRRQTDGFPNQLVIGSSTGSPPPPYTETTTNTGAVRYIFGDYGDKKMFDDAISAKLQYAINEATLFKIAYIRTEIATENGVRHDVDGVPVYGNTDLAKHTGYSSSYYGTPWGRIRNVFQSSIETTLMDIYTKLSFSILDTPDYYQLYPDTSSGYSWGTGYLNNILSRNYTVDWQLTTPEFFHQTFTTGVTFEHDTADSAYYLLNNWKDRESATGLRAVANAISGGKTDIWAVYLQDEISILKNLSVYLGGRFDWWKAHDGYTQDTTSTAGIDHNFVKYDVRDAWAFSPKASIVYNPLDITTIRVSGGRAFSTPNIYELFSSYQTSIANPDLDPETVWSWDASVTQDIFGVARFSLGYFANYMEDLISTGGVTIDGTPHSRFNIGKATAWGLETGIDIKFFMFIFKTNYTYTNAVCTEDKSKPANEGKYLINVPEHVFNLGLEGKYKHFSGFIGGRYVSKRWNNADNTDTTEGVSGSRDPYFLVDAKLAYAITEYFTVSLAANNLFNWEYFEGSYKAPGASWTVGFEMNL